MLSPYRAQVQCLQQKLEIHYKNSEFFKVEVGLVDDYQGEKVDVVIISTVGLADGDVCRNQNNTSVYFTWARYGSNENVYHA